FARNRERDHRGTAGAGDRLERKERLAAERIRLADDEVDAGIDGPADLLVEDTPRLLVRFGVVESVDARVADVAGEESPRLARDLLGDAERDRVDLLEIALPPADLELGSMRVVGERLHDVRAGVNELAVQRLHQIGPLEHDLWNVRARLEIPPSLELEQI